jgi:hypothetical protein
MAALDLTSFDAALKQHYTADRVQMAVYKDFPLLAMLAKMEKFGGKNLPIPITYGTPQGRSASFAKAKAGKKPGKYTDFVLTRDHDYALYDLDNETMLASMGNENAFMQAATVEVDGAILSIKNSLAGAVFRDGLGWIGQVNAEPSTNASTFLVTLKSADDVVNFEVGQTLVIYSASTGGSKRTSDGSDDEWEIAAINRDTGVLTLTGTYSGSGDIAANDYIFVDGDEDSKVKGLAAWLPYTAPSSSLFFGVDRSVDTVRLAGVRMDCSAVSQEEAAINLVTRINREGGNPDAYFLNHDNYRKLELELGSKVQYQKVKVPFGKAEISFEGIRLSGPKSSVTVLPDPKCPVEYGYMLQMNTWKLYSLGKAPMMLDQDGNKWLRNSDSDSIEGRIGYYAQLGCNAPGFNGVAKLR